MGRTAIVGLGWAGRHAAKTLRAGAPKMQIDVCSGTACAPYNPMLTTCFASGKLREEGLFPFGDLETVRKAPDLNILTESPVTPLPASVELRLIRGGVPAGLIEIPGGTKCGGEPDEIRF